MGHKDILISGASVAGPALAWWLARRGFRPVIVERSWQLRGGGYAVDFRGEVHLSVLRQMGLLEQIQARQTHLRSLSCVDEQGRPTASVPPEFFAGDVEILRGDLAGVFYQATRNDTEYIFGDSVTSLEQDDGGVHVTFAGAAPRTFGLVVGADGVHSGIRRLAFGPDERFSRGLGLYTSIFTVPNFADLDRAGLLYSEPGRTAGLFAAGDPARAIAQLYFTAPDLRYDWRGGAQQEQDIITGQFGGLGWQVPRLLAEMPAATDFYFDTASQIRMDSWSNGRVAVIGDAGYAAGPVATEPVPRSSPPTSWPGNSPPPAVITGPRSPATSSGCAATSRAGRSRRPAARPSSRRRRGRRSASATGSTDCSPTCPSAP